MMSNPAIPSNPTPTAEELEKLRLFQKRVGDLRESGVVQHGQITLKVTFPLSGREKGEEIPFEGFNKDHFGAAMQTFRQFLMDGDAVFFFGICNIIWRKCDRQDLK